jgi:hypothetical protein
MGDHRATIKLSMSFHGVEDETEMWINYMPDSDGVDRRVTEWFKDVYERGMERYEAGEKKRRRLELARDRLAAGTPEGRPEFRERLIRIDSCGGQGNDVVWNCTVLNDDHTIKLDGEGRPVTTRVGFRIGGAHEMRRDEVEAEAGIEETGGLSDADQRD